MLDMEEQKPKITLITKLFFLKFYLKNGLKSILGVNKKFGPEEVVDVLIEYSKQSMFKGLIKINEGCQNADIVFAEGLNEVELKYLIKLKRRYKFKLVIHHGFSHPRELNNIEILDSIDFILVPSEWVKELFISEDKSLSKKVISLAWPCYEYKVKQSERAKEMPKKCLIYDKSLGFDSDNDYCMLIDNLTITLLSKGIEITIIKYKHYNNHDYLEQLSKTDMMVYLSNQETQGLAQMQAWRNNVPTLTYDRGFAKWSNVVCPGSSVPYYNVLVGEKFNDIDNFEETLNNFMIKYKTYKPQLYYEENFSYQIVFPKLDSFFLKIIKSENTNN